MRVFHLSHDISSSSVPMGVSVLLWLAARAGHAVRAAVHPIRSQGFLAAALFLFGVPALAQDAAPSPLTLTHGLIMLNVLVAGLGLVATVVWLVKATRPSPALHKQFADLAHNHPDYVTRPELSDALEKVSRDVDAKLDASARRDERVDVKLDNISKDLRDGFGHVHKRIDPLAETLAATASALKVHLENHPQPHQGTSHAH